MALAHHKLGSSHKDKEIDKGRTKAKRQAGGQGVQIGGLHTTQVKKSSVHTSGSLSLQIRELFGFINVSVTDSVFVRFPFVSHLHSIQHSDSDTVFNDVQCSDSATVFNDVQDVRSFITEFRL